ncbi:hypothetical protein [Spirosoma rhododendri]|uniref:Uncharacterized protein n=1 Tax=Spirosoma rhododendri TaxID=2728024 RepID=A0A7L5DN51_9BACT|nr:hypothetical protein [Spirosoma rhododendri]QJD79914.1 hypothetical protein HH216_16945 [Spirosoma rhododendri]
MNQTFSLSRFGRLLRTYFVENRNVLLANVAVLFVGLAGLAFLIYSSFPWSIPRTRAMLLFFAGGVAWYVFTVQQITLLNEKERAITYLLRPASKLEKWAQLVLVSGLGFIIAYTLLFTVIDTVGVWYVNHREWKPEQLKDLLDRSTIKPWFEPSQLREIPPMLWVDALLLHPVALALALLIRRYTLPLIPVILFFALILVILINHQLLSGMIDSVKEVSASPFDKMSVLRTSDDWKTVALPQPVGDAIRYGVGALVMLLLYVMAFFRLKEREV